MNDITITIIVSTLTILLFIGLVVLLLAVSHNRRNRHRAALAEVRARHSEEVRKVEQEVLAQTLTEVGRDLHDNIGQLLTVTRMGVNKLLTGDPGNVHVPEVKANIDTAITEVRRLSRQLNTDRWDQVTLTQAIANECERVRRSATVEVGFQDNGYEPFIAADHKLVLFRIFQEAMNNALKHAKAKRIEVKLADGERVRLEVNDDGIGFAATGATGQGLANIQRRAALIGYRCEVVSQPGKGTTISVSQI